jgi:ribosome-binding factor A
MNHRRARVAQELRDRLAEVLGRRVQDPRLELVTITGVDVSADFSFARVYYRTVNDPAAAAEALGGAKRFIRRALAEGLPLRRVPELDFRLDETADQAARVEEILDEIQKGRQERERGGSDPVEE